MWCHSNQKALFVDCALLSSAPKLPSRLSNVLWVCRHSVNSKWSLYYIASTCGFRQLTLVCVVLLSVSNNTCDQLNTDGVTLFVFKGEASWLGAVALLYRKMLDFKSVSAAAWTSNVITNRWWRTSFLFPLPLFCRLLSSFFASYCQTFWA